jgi:hypothetical protein
MAQRGFVTEFMLSCACADRASLAAAQFRGSTIYMGDSDRETDATYADGGPRAAEGFCGAHEGCVVAVKSKDG